MKILYLSFWFPYPPNNGSRIRTYNLIKELNKKHDVYLVSLLQDDSVREDAAKLDDICKVVSLHEAQWFKPTSLKSFIGFFSRRPRMLVDMFDANIKSAVAESVKTVNPDVLLVSTYGVADYVPDDLDIPMVLEEQNCEYASMRRDRDKIPAGLRRFRYDLTWKKMAKWQTSLVKRFDGVVMVSENDRKRLLEIAPNAKVSVVPNGVDVDYYDPSKRNPKKGYLLYNGALSFEANRDAAKFFASAIYPTLQKKLPEAKLRITGSIKNVNLTGISDCPGIELTGYVDDIRDVLYKAEVCVVPLGSGGGSRLKILEAMAAGVPVVSTSVGAEGLEVVDGEHLLIANTPNEFAEAIKTISEDSALADKLSRQARRSMEERYSWTVIGNHLTSILESIIN